LIELVLATANPHKVEEIRPLLDAIAGIRLVPVTALVDGWDLEETGDTLEENALLKARAAARATRMPAVGDDTGLFVAALDGAPGVRSSRYAGPQCSYEDNRRTLLAALTGVEGEGRGALFRTVVALACPDGSERVFEGAVEGSIAGSPRGTGGFGYDPVFVLAEGATLAELSLQAKNEVSHRAAAFRAFAAWLSSRGADRICPCDPGVG
jgi:XTP/dITP diphosphohydrolase